MRPMGALDSIERMCDRRSGERELRAAVLAELSKAVPFDAYAWLLTDPRTEVGAAPLAEVPSRADLPTLVRRKYLTATNRWTSLPPGTATSLHTAIGESPSRSRGWRQLLADYGIDDVASLVFRDRFGCWGWLDLWRAHGHFTRQELELLAGLDRPVTPALRRSLDASFETDRAGHQEQPEPVVLILTDDLEPIAETPPVDAHLRALLPTEADRSPVPAAAYNVAAQLLAREQGIDDHAPSARAYHGDGIWVTVSAARLRRPGSETTRIAVTIEPTSATDRTDLLARVIGLTARESELLGYIVSGSDTREIARRMFLSEHTVQDHLKSIFGKADVHTRRLLVARATGLR